MKLCLLFIMTHEAIWSDHLWNLMLIDHFWAYPKAYVFAVRLLSGWYHVVWPWHKARHLLQQHSEEVWVLLTVLQLPEPRRKVAEVFVVQRCLGWQAVLWEALKEPGGQLLSMVHIAQPDTHKHTPLESDYKDSLQYTEKYLYKTDSQPIKTQETKHICSSYPSYHITQSSLWESSSFFLQFTELLTTKIRPDNYAEGLLTQEEKHFLDTHIFKRTHTHKLTPFSF